MVNFFKMNLLQTQTKLVFPKSLGTQGFEPMPPATSSPRRPKTRPVFIVVFNVTVLKHN